MQPLSVKTDQAKLICIDCDLFYIDNLHVEWLGRFTERAFAETWNNDPQCVEELIAGLKVDWPTEAITIGDKAIVSLPGFTNLLNHDS